MSVYFLFAGQGIGFEEATVFAEKHLAETRTQEAGKVVLQLAEQVFGFDVMRLTDAQWKCTKWAQPALFVQSVLAFQTLQQKHPEVFSEFYEQIYAGFSLGELTALYCAGKFESLESAFKLVKLRANMMQLVCDSNPRTSLTTLFNPVREHMNEQTVVNDLYDECVVVLNEDDYDEKHFVPRYAERATLRKSLGPFHSKYMHPVGEAIKKCDFPIEAKGTSRNLATVIANETGEAYALEDENLKEALARQVMNPVQWNKTIKGVVQDPNLMSIVLVGPSRHLETIISRIDPKLSSLITKLE